MQCEAIAPHQCAYASIYHRISYYYIMFRHSIYSVRHLYLTLSDGKHDASDGMRVLLFTCAVKVIHMCCKGCSHVL